LTKPQKVIAIVRPPAVGLPAAPAVELSEPITRAVEMMLRNDLKMIAVTSRGHLIGHVQLSEALNLLGIRIPGKLPAT
jgi:hypothetical protein